MQRTMGNYHRVQGKYSIVRKKTMVDYQDVSTAELQAKLQQFVPKPKVFFFCQLLVLHLPVQHGICNATTHFKVH